MSNKNEPVQEQSKQRARARADLEPLARLLCATNLLGMGKSEDGSYGSKSMASVLAVCGSESENVCLPMFWVGDGTQAPSLRSAASFLGCSEKELPSEYARVARLAYEASERLGVAGLDQAIDKAGGEPVGEPFLGAKRKSITQDMCRQWMSVGLVDLESLSRLASEAASVGWALDFEDAAWVEAAVLEKASAAGKKARVAGSLRV